MKRNNSGSETGYFIRAMIGTVIGSVLLALGTDLFLLKGQLISGGFSGIALLLNYLLGWNIPLVYFLMNIPLFLLAWKFLNFRSFLLSIFGAIFFSLSVQLFQNLSVPYESTLTMVVLGGALYGLGSGIILRAGGMTGGTDIIGRLLHKFFNLSMPTTALVFNAILFSVFAFLRGLDTAVLTLVVYLVATVVSKAVLEGLDHRRSVTIITNEGEAISRALINRLNRGVSVMEVRGAYTNETHAMLYTVISNWQVARVKSIIREMDPQAFMTITEVQNVYGKGFAQVKDIAK